MADGTIRFDTEIDNSKIEKALNSILKTVQAFSGNSSKAFKEVDESAEKISDTMSKVADSVNQVSAGDMEKLTKQWDNLNAQIEVQQKLVRDIITLDHPIASGIYQEIEWTMSLSYDGEMKHTAQRMVIE